jgi:hypothetical protein
VTDTTLLTVRIICGNGSDGNRGDLHRAIDVARQLQVIGAWNGEDDIVIHAPHDTHRELQHSGKPELHGVINVYPGVHDLVAGEHYEILAPASPQCNLATCTRPATTRFTFQGDDTAFCYCDEHAGWQRALAASRNERLFGVTIATDEPIGADDPASEEVEAKFDTVINHLIERNHLSRRGEVM